MTLNKALKAAPGLEGHYPQEFKSPLSDQKLHSISTSECEDCALRFTSYKTVFEKLMR